MKRNIVFFLTSVFICLSVACYDDKGSYDYKDVNEVEVDGLGTSYNLIFKKDTLKITPELKFTQDSLNLDRYGYEWIVVSGISGSEETREVIGTERNLKYFVELEPGTYTLYLKVRDKQTGLLWMNYTSLTVRTEVGLGWLLIGEDAEGYVNVDMIAMPNDTIVINNLLSNNGLPRLKGPKSIMYTGSPYASYLAPYEKLWIATEDRSYYVNTSTFEGELTNVFEMMVYSYLDIPEQLNPVHLLSQRTGGSMNTSRSVACAEGFVFNISSLLSGGDYANPLNRTADAPEKLFKAYPYIFASLGYVSGGVLYDTDNGRFLRFTSSGSTSTALLDNSGEAFPWIQPEGRTLVYGENTMDTEGGSRGNSFTLMKDAGTGKYFIYKFYAYGSSAQKRAGYEVKSSLATDIDKAEFYAFASNRSLLLYVVGKTLYAYDYKVGCEKLYSMDLPDEVSMMKFDVKSGYGDYNDLYIATYNSTTGGTLQKYVLGTDQNKFELKPDERCYWTGLVKVKDMEWKNSAQ